MTKKLKRFTDPLFIAALTLLLLNDFIFKQLYPGIFTGILSDFAGLTAFTLFMSFVIPRFKEHLCFIVALAFVFWKSPLSQDLINTWNGLPFFDIGRVVDPLDLLALIVLPGVCLYRPHPITRLNIPAVRISLAALAVFAFCATSYRRVHEYDKEYRFPFPVEELVGRINHLSATCQNTPLSCDMSIVDTCFVYDSDTNFISYEDTSYTYIDTLYEYNQALSKYTDKIDTIITRVVRNTDTIIVHGDNPISFSFDASPYWGDKKDSFCACLQARVRFIDKGASSIMLLEEIDMGHCFDNFRETGEKKEKELILQAFESLVVGRLL